MILGHARAHSGAAASAHSAQLPPDIVFDVLNTLVGIELFEVQFVVPRAGVDTLGHVTGFADFVSLWRILLC